MFPMTVTLHNQTQLAALLAVMGMPAGAVGTAPGEPSTSELVQIAKDRTAQNTQQKDAAAPVEKSAPKETAARGQRTATAEAAAAQGKTEGAQASSAAGSAEAAPQGSTAATEAAEKIAYDVVAGAITAGVKANRQHVVDTLAKFGAKKGTDLKPADYAAFLTDLGA